MTRNLYDPNSCSWYRLSLDVSNALIPGIVEGLAFSGDIKVWEFLPEEILTAEWLAQCQLPVTEVLVFQRDSTKVDTAAHIDHAQNRELTLEDWSYLPAAINWCVGPDHKPMQWWSAEGRLGETEEFRKSLESDTVDSGGYVVWPLANLELIDQCLIGNAATLVRIDQPHSIAQGPGSRTSVTVRLRPWCLEWHRIVRDLAPWITV